jgi:hypothetical protein
MSLIHRHRGWLAAGLGIALVLLPAGAGIARKSGGPERPIYLTWKSPDTSTTMTVIYHGVGKGAESQVFFDTEPRFGDTTRYRYRAFGDSAAIPGKRRRRVHSVELTGLSPGETYYFVAGDVERGVTAERAFRTIPNDGRPLRFGAGGDISAGKFAFKMARMIASQNPDAVFLGGDIAYARGEQYGLWKKWLRLWTQTMITDGGLTIPLVAAAGNHDVTKRPYFKRLFNQGGRPYFHRLFGPHMVLLVLDSGNFVPHDGAQARWLRDTMAATVEYPAALALYHHPLYPAHKPFDEPEFVAGREVWRPIFDRFGLTAGLEHHDHLYKRTKPLRRGRPADGGTVYIGGGSWGVAPRPVHWKSYLRTAKPKAAVLIVDVRETEIEYRGLNAKGELLDGFLQPLTD